MPPTLTHAEYPRARLLRLLDDLDGRREPAATAVLPPGAGEAGRVPAGVDPAGWDEVAQHALRSETGACIFAAAQRVLAVAPPYPLREPLRAEGYQTAALRSLLALRPRIAVVLLRYGGYAVGVFHGDQLLEARNDGRFVKNRHRKGGQSQRRFDRIREKQIHELFGKACADAEVRLAPHSGALDWLAYGGDRHTVAALLKECRFLREFACPVLPRFLTVPEPRHETLERLPVLLSTSRVTEWTA